LGQGSRPVPQLLRRLRINENIYELEDIIAKITTTQSCSYIPLELLAYLARFRYHSVSNSSRRFPLRTEYLKMSSFSAVIVMAAKTYNIIRIGRTVLHIGHVNEICGRDVKESAIEKDTTSHQQTAIVIAEDL
jgi:hypothetical protein